MINNNSIRYSIWELTVSSSGVQYFARPLTTWRGVPSPTSISSTSKLHKKYKKIPFYISKVFLHGSRFFCVHARTSGLGRGCSLVPVSWWMFLSAKNTTNLYVEQRNATLSILRCWVLWCFLFLLCFFITFCFSFLFDCCFLLL